MLDSFLESFTLVSETNTQITFICPICGENKLKINKNTEKYWCYANSCPTNLIFKKLKPNSFFKTDSFTRIPKKYKKQYSIHPEIHYNFKQLSTCKLDVRLYSIEGNLTKYFYDSTHYLLRTDLENGDKYFIPYSLDVKGNDGNFKYYFPCIDICEGSIFVVEGEKCVISLVSRGYSSLSLYQAYSSNQSKIEEFILEISKNYSWVKDYGFIYITDYDRVGEIKGIKFKEVCNFLRIPCKLVKIEKLIDNSFFSVHELCELSSGFDIYDLLQIQEVDIKKIPLINS